MLQFLKKIFLFAATQGVLFSGLLILAHYVPDPFIGSLREKHLHLDGSARPRLILIGGSNVAFGFQCELLADALPYAPTNLAVHAGLGLEFILADALPAVGHDDLVVLSLEYRLMKQKPYSRETWEGLLLRPGAVAGMNCAKLTDAGLGFVGHVTNRGLQVLIGRNRTGGESIYNRYSFNKFGDVAAHRSLAPVRPFVGGEPREVKTLGCEAEDLLPNLQAFIAACEDKGAKVLIFFPPIPKELFEAHRAELESYLARQRELFGNRVLGRLEDIPYLDQEFYDTYYHLTGSGSARHTEQVIERIKSYDITLPLLKKTSCAPRFTPMPAPDDRGRAAENPAKSI